MKAIVRQRLADSMAIYLPKNPATHFTVNKFFHHLKSQGIKVAKTTVHEYIDHLAEYLDGRCQIIQVAADVSDSGTREREVRSLVEAGRDEKGASLPLLNLSEETSIAREGMTIEILPAWKWLLDSEQD